MRRGIVFIAATGLAASILLTFFHDKLEHPSKSPGGSGVPEYHDAAKLIETAVGSEFAIALEASQTSGTRWQFEDVADKLLLQLVEIKHSATKAKQGGMQLKDLWIFKGLRDGRTVLSFKKTGSAGDQTQPAEERNFSVAIKGKT